MPDIIGAVFHLPPIDPVTGLRLMHGNGCKHAKSCFDCPLIDCKWEYWKNTETRKLRNNLQGELSL